MRKAAAWSVRGVEPATQEIAEEAARRAGMSLGDWLDQVVAEQAAEQGIATDDLDEEDKLDAIAERLTRLSRRADRPGARPPREELRAGPRMNIPKPSIEEARIARERLDAAIAKFESRAAKNEERTARAFESVASWIERDQMERLEERETLQTVAEKLATIERRSQRDSELLRAAVAQKSEREVEAASRIDARLDALASRIAGPRDSARKPEPAAARARVDFPHEPELAPAVSRAPRSAARPLPQPETEMADWDAQAEEREAPRRASRAASRPDVEARRLEPLSRAETREPVRLVRRAPEQDRAAEWDEPTPKAPERVSPTARELAMEARLEELAHRVAASEQARVERPRLDVRAAVEQIAKRRVESVAPTPLVAPAEKAAVVPARNGLRNFGVDVPPEPAPASPSIDDLRKEMAALDERLARIRALRDERRSAAPDAADLKAGLASMSRSVADLAPRNANVALEGAVGDLGQRLASARDAGASERLVAPVEAMVRQVLDALRERDARAPASALEREIRAMGAKIEALANATADPELLRRIRAQSDEIRTLLATAAMNPVPVERLERQIGQLADRVERIASSPAPQAETAQILQLLAEVHAQIERSTPARALNAIEQRLEQLAARVDDAVRRPPPPGIDTRAIEDLARRVDGMRHSLERQTDERPNLAPLETALREINAKLDRAPPGAGDSKALMTTLLGLSARLEETFKQAKFAQVDAKPLEDLSRKIDGVRAAVEHQSDFGKHAARFEAALDELGAKLDRPPPPAPESPALASTLRDLQAKLDAAFRRPAATTIDSKPLEDLGRRIDGIRAAMERPAGPGPVAPELKAALREIDAKLDRQATTPLALDPKPLEDLAGRIDAMRATVERQANSGVDVAELKATLQAIDGKLDRVNSSPTPLRRRSPDDLSQRLDEMRSAMERLASPSAVAPELKAALREIDAKLDRRAATSPIALDPAPLQDLARRIDSVRVVVERQAGPSPDTAQLMTGLREVGAKIDQLAAAPIPIDSRPLDELARRIDSVRATVERQAGANPNAEELKAALREVGAKLDRQAASPVPFDPKPLQDFARLLEDTRATLEQRSAQAVEASDLKAALREISAKLDSQGSTPMTLDPTPLDDLARRIDEVRATVERHAGSAPDTSELKAALRDIGAKFDAHIAAPAPFDPRPLDDLARRIDSVRAAVERQADQGPAAQDIVYALRDIGAKLDRQANSPAGHDPGALADLARRVDEVLATVSQQADRRPDSPAVETALSEISARLDRQASSPVRLDPRPLEDLGRRIDDVRAILERQADRGPDSAELRTALRDIDAKLDRQQATPSAHDPKPLEDLARRIDDVRASVERQALRAPDAPDVTAALRDIHEKLDRHAASPAEADARSLEDLGRRIDEMRASVSRQIMERPDASILEPALREISEKLDRHAAASVTLDNGPLDDLARRIDDMRASLERQADLGLDSFRWEAALREISAKLDSHAVTAEDSRALIDVVQELAARVEKSVASGVDVVAMETVLRDLGDKLTGLDTWRIDAALRDLTAKISTTSAPAIDIGALERTLDGLDAKLDEIARASGDTRTLELAVNALRAELANRPEAQIDARLVEQAADLLAQKFEKRNISALDTEALVSQISEIHGRLDTFDISSASHAALERTVADLIEELETTRQILQSTAAQDSALAPLASGIAELRAEQANSDRRMESRLFGVQGILEKLADRISRWEDEADDIPDAAPPRAETSIKPPPLNLGTGASDFNLRNIPDRDASVSKHAPSSPPASARPIEAPSIMIEPGAVSPARNAAINAHIAAARRAAQTAMVEHAEKAEAPEPPAVAPKPMAGLGASVARASAMFAKHRRPILLGATAAALTVAATVAVVEMRGGHSKEMQKSELNTPADGAPNSPVSDASTKSPALDYDPTGAIGATSGKSAAVSDKPAAPTVAKSVAGDLLASLPATLPSSLRDAASVGDSGAETEIAFRYLEGRTVSRDFKLAARWFELAAADGLPLAQYRLAALYEKGNGVPRDLTLARSWYSKAAAAGNARAMHNLAVLCAQDAGAGKPDYPQAAQWFRRAADLGIRDSQFNLGVLYGRGLGVPQDLGNSWLWFSLASRQGDSDAAKKRDEVAAKMDATQMAAAVKALADFKVQPLDRQANEAPVPAGGWDGKAGAPQANSPATQTRL